MLSFQPGACRQADFPPGVGAGVGAGVSAGVGPPPPPPPPPPPAEHSPHSGQTS